MEPVSQVWLQSLWGKLGAESLVGNPGPHPKSWALPGGILAARSGTSNDGAK